MGNMSYCRFENTSLDLRDCEEVLVGMVAGDEEPLSDEELRSSKRLVQSCARIFFLLHEYATQEEQGQLIEGSEQRRETVLKAIMDRLNKEAGGQADEEEEE